MENQIKCILDSPKADHADYPNSFLDKITDCPDKGNAVDLICLHFRKAFGTAVLSKLFKMVRMGVSTGVVK